MKITRKQVDSANKQLDKAFKDIKLKTVSGKEILIPRSQLLKFRIKYLALILETTRQGAYWILNDLEK